MLISSVVAVHGNSRLSFSHLGLFRYRYRWCFDDIVAGLVRSSKKKFELLQSVCTRLAGERWRERDTGRTVLHTVLDECRFSTLGEMHAFQLASAILELKPDMENAADNAGVTAAEIAASCTAPQVQKLMLMGT